MVNEVECWQCIISMTSKGVVISRCFSPPCHELRVVSHPRVIVLIQVIPIGSSPAPASHLHLTLPSVPSRLRIPLPSPPSMSSLLKHNFRRQTKRVGVVYNEARLVRFLDSAVFSSYPCVPCKDVPSKSNLNVNPLPHTRRFSKSISHG